MRSVADATCSRRVIPEQVITYLGCNRYPAGVSISPRIRAAGRLSTPSICLKDCALASIAKEPHPEAIHGIKREIGKIGALRPGSLSKQARKTKSTHGAYWHLSYTHRGKGHKQYIRDAFVPQVKAEVSNFKRFRKLIDRLITLSIERSQLRIKADKKQ